MKKVVGILGLVFISVASWAGGTLNFVVNSTLDVPDTVLDGVCHAGSTRGLNFCTLRAALMEANANAGITNISFDLNDPGCTGDICVIQVDQDNLGALPDITQMVNIDGSTQPGNSGVCGAAIGSRSAYQVVIQGQSTDVGLRLAAGADGSTIKGLNIRNFFNNVAIIDSNNNTVACNFIGTDETGMTSSGGNDANGIIFGCDSKNNVIGGVGLNDGNLISGHAGDGLQFYAGFGCFESQPLMSNNAILGNYIGTDKTGQSVLGNTYSGISFFGGAAFDNYIGVLQDGTSVNGNVIGGNDSGIYISDGSNNTVILGNYLGTDPSGMADLGNVYGGVDIINGIDNVVGGINADEANLIANNGDGVFITGLNSAGNSIRGNILAENELSAIELVVDGSVEPDGLNPNDVDDADVGANQLMNHPDIVNAEFIDLSGALFVEVEYSVDASEANVTYPIQIDAYFNDMPGKVNQAIYLGMQTYVLPQQITTAVYGLPDGVMGGAISLVATDADGNSSELSLPYEVGFVDLIFKDDFD